MTRVPQDPLRLGRTRREWPLKNPIQVYNISQHCDDASPRFLWGSIQYDNFAFWGLVQRDLWGPLRPGKISGHSMSQYSLQVYYVVRTFNYLVIIIINFKLIWDGSRFVILFFKVDLRQYLYEILIWKLGIRNRHFRIHIIPVFPNNIVGSIQNF